MSGLIARFGQQYLITLTASDCVGGQDLVQTKVVAANRDNMLQAMDSAASQMRRRLGEPLKSLQRFDKPLLAKATGWLDALKAYSAAHELGMQGKFQESIPLFRRAIRLDPWFAIAYGDLGAVYGNLEELGLSAAAGGKVFELRDFADECDRLYIAAVYHSNTTGDLHAGIRDYDTWMEMYPRDVSPLTNLADLRTQIGQPELAIEPAKRPGARPKERDRPYRAGPGPALVYAGFAKHDRAMMEAQSAWAKGRRRNPLLPSSKCSCPWRAPNPGMASN